MVHGKNRIPYRIDRRLNDLAGPESDATISFGLPFEPEDSQYGKSRIIWGVFPRCVCHTHTRLTGHRPLPSGVSGGRRGRVIARPLGGGSSTTP